MNVRIMKTKMDRIKQTVAEMVGVQRDDDKVYLQSESGFNQLLHIETKRAERSKAPPLLMLIDISEFKQVREKENMVSKLSSALLSTTREVDIKGWYKYDSVVGVMFIEAGRTRVSPDVLPDAMVSIVQKRLSHFLGGENAERISISCCALSQENPSQISDRTLGQDPSAGPH